MRAECLVPQLDGAGCVELLEHELGERTIHDPAEDAFVICASARREFGEFWRAGDQGAERAFTRRGRCTDVELAHPQEEFNGAWPERNAGARIRNARTGRAVIVVSAPFGPDGVYARMRLIMTAFVFPTSRRELCSANA